MKRFIISVVVVLFPVLFLTGCGEGDGKAASSLVAINLRKQPTSARTSYFIEIPKNEDLDVFFKLEGKDFLLVRYKTYVGFVPTQYVSLDSVNTIQTDKAVIKITANLRIQPYTNMYPSYYEIPVGTKVTYYPYPVYTDDMYYLVKYKGKFGFIPKNFLD